jgi:hypothetical protein
MKLPANLAGMSAFVNEKSKEAPGAMADAELSDPLVHWMTQPLVGAFGMCVILEDHPTWFVGEVARKSSPGTQPYQKIPMLASLEPKLVSLVASSRLEPSGIQLNSALAVMFAAFAKGCAQTRAAATNKITRFMLPPRCFSPLRRAARSDAKPV